MTDLHEAREVAEQLLERLAPWTERAVIAGSIRRQCAEVKDIEIVVQPDYAPSGFFDEPRLATGEIRELALTWGPKSKAGDKYIQIMDVLGSGITLDLFVVTPPATWGAILAIRTGPAAFSEMLVTRIKGRLWRCREGRVTDQQGAVVPTPTERSFFAAAQVDWLEPEDRR